MTTYERTLIAHGVSPEAARRDALANELVRLTNREHPAYGVTDFPARHLTALPSRQVVGSSPRDDADWCAFVAATSGAIR